MPKINLIFTTEEVNEAMKDYCEKIGYDVTDRFVTSYSIDGTDEVECVVLSGVLNKN